MEVVKCQHQHDQTRYHYLHVLLELPHRLVQFVHVLHSGLVLGLAGQNLLKLVLHFLNWVRLPISQYWLTFDLVGKRLDFVVECCFDLGA